MLHGGLRANPIQYLKPAILGQFQIQEHEAWKWEPLSIRIAPVSIQIIYCLATVPDDLQRVKQPRSFHGVLHEKHIILGVLYQQNGASIRIHALHNTPQIQAWKSLYQPVSFAAQPSFGTALFLPTRFFAWFAGLRVGFSGKIALAPGILTD